MDIILFSKYTFVFQSIHSKKQRAVPNYYESMINIYKMYTLLITVHPTLLLVQLFKYCSSCDLGKSQNVCPGDQLYRETTSLTSCWLVMGGIFFKLTNKNRPRKMLTPATGGTNNWSLTGGTFLTIWKWLSPLHTQPPGHEFRDFHYSWNTN